MAEGSSIHASEGGANSGVGLEGWLWKKGRIHKNWKRRWMVLSMPQNLLDPPITPFSADGSVNESSDEFTTAGPTVAYYTSPSSKYPKGIIPLVGAQVSGLTKGRHQHQQQEKYFGGSTNREDDSASLSAPSWPASGSGSFINTVMGLRKGHRDKDKGSTIDSNVGLTVSGDVPIGNNSNSSTEKDSSGGTPTDYYYFVIRTAKGRKYRLRCESEEQSKTWVDKLVAVSRQALHNPVVQVVTVNVTGNWEHTSMGANLSPSSSSSSPPTSSSSEVVQPATSSLASSPPIIYPPPHSSTPHSGAPDKEYTFENPKKGGSEIRPRFATRMKGFMRLQKHTASNLSSRYALLRGKYEPKQMRKLFGVRLEELEMTSAGVPIIIDIIFSYLEKALDVQGLFRLSGAADKVRKLKQSYETAKDMKDVQLPHDLSEGSHSVASLLKLFLKELPEPLIPYSHYPLFLKVQTSTVIEETQRLRQLRGLIHSLPDAHRNSLAALCRLLLHVSERSHVNQMTVRNVAICIAPNIFHTVGDDLFKTMQDAPLILSITKTFINQYEYLFGGEDNISLVKLKEEGGNVTSPTSKSSTSTPKQIQMITTTTTPTSTATTTTPTLTSAESDNPNPAITDSSPSSDSSSSASSSSLALPTTATDIDIDFQLLNEVDIFINECCTSCGTKTTKLTISISGQALVKEVDDFLSLLVVSQ